MCVYRLQYEIILSDCFILASDERTKAWQRGYDCSHTLTNIFHHLVDLLSAATAEGPKSKVSSGGSVGRVWWEEGEGEEEREQRRRGEQAARNARLMYNLQQQVTLLIVLWSWKF